MVIAQMDTAHLAEAAPAINLAAGFRHRGMRVLVWQWGRRGAGPRFAAALADGLRLVPGTEAVLSLSTGAEILRGPDPPDCQFPMATYSGVIGLTFRWLRAPLIVAQLSRR